MFPQFTYASFLRDIETIYIIVDGVHVIQICQEFSANLVSWQVALNFGGDVLSANNNINTHSTILRNPTRISRRIKLWRSYT